MGWFSKYLNNLRKKNEKIHRGPVCPSPLHPLRSIGIRRRSHTHKGTAPCNAQNHSVGGRRIHHPLQGRWCDPRFSIYPVRCHDRMEVAGKIRDLGDCRHRRLQHRLQARPAGNRRHRLQHRRPLVVWWRAALPDQPRIWGHRYHKPTRHFCRTDCKVRRGSCSQHPDRCRKVCRGRTGINGYPTRPLIHFLVLSARPSPSTHLRTKPNMLSRACINKAGHSFLYYHLMSRRQQKTNGSSAGFLFLFHLTPTMVVAHLHLNRHSQLHYIFHDFFYHLAEFFFSLLFHFKHQLIVHLQQHFRLWPIF